MRELFGTPCIIANQCKIQNKTSKHKFVNWFYKNIYGYKYDSVLPEGTDIIYVNGELIFRNIEVFNNTMEDLGVRNYE